VSDWEPFVKPSPFLDSIGPFWQRERDGVIEIGLTIEQRHCNARGRAHGGLVATLCDMALGHNVASRPEATSRYLTTSLNVDYLGAASAGQHVTVFVDRVRAGNTLGFAQAAVMADDRWIARASGIFTAQNKTPRS
jgi:acyl-coenzyme A thioesterase 13